MLQAYLEEGLHGVAVFELFVRRLPGPRNDLVLAGIEQAVAYLESLQVSEPELAWLERQGRFSSRTLDHLARMRFEGDVDAMPEGTVFFADEPVLQVTAPLPQAQFVESSLLNLIHFQTLVASKAARLVHAGQGRPSCAVGPMTPRNADPFWMQRGWAMSASLPAATSTNTALPRCSHRARPLMASV